MRIPSVLLPLPLALAAGTAHAQSVLPTWTRGADGLTPSPSLVFDNNSSRYNLLSWHRDGPDKPPVLALVAWVELNGQRGSMATWDGRKWELYPEIPNPSNMGRSVVFDPDGPGPRPELIAAIRNGQASSRVVTWDGSAWTPAGQLTEPINSSWGTLTTWDPDGPGPSNPVLIHANQRVSAWNGEGDWLDLGAVSSSAPIRVNSAIAFDPDGPAGNPPRLVIGGFFTAVNGVQASNVAIYNGSTWAPIPGLTAQSPVGALAVHDFDAQGPALPELVIPTRASIAAQFTDLVAWNGSSFRPAALGTFNQLGMLSYPHNAASFDIPGFQGLLTYGQFTSFAGSPVANVARLNANTLAPLSSVPGAGFDNFYIDSIVAVDLDGNGPDAPALFATGPNLSSNAVSMPTVARWNGSRWQPLSSLFTHPSTNSRVDSISVIEGPTPDQSQTYLQGSFSGFGGVVGFGGIARSSNSGVAPIGSGINDISVGTSSVLSFDPDDQGPLPPKLFASGWYINSWNGSQWTREASPFSNLARRMCLHDFDGPGPNPPRLIATGNSSPMGQVVQFDGSTWSPIGGGIGIGGTGVATDVLSFDHDGDGPQLPILYAVGNILSAEGRDLNKAAYFDGSSWNPMGLGWINPRGLLAFDLDGTGPRPTEIIGYGGGSSQAPPDIGNRVSAWDGSTWRELGELNSTINALTAFDPDGNGPRQPFLVAAGFFTASGSTQLPRGLAFWDNNALAWRPLSTPDLIDTFFSLAVERPWGPGGPERLVVGGSSAPLDPNVPDPRPTGAVARYTDLGRAWCSTPPQDTSISAGASILLSAQLHPAYGPAGAQYSWLRNGIPVSNGPGGAAPGGGTVSLATGSLNSTNLSISLRIDNASTLDAGTYTLILTNPAGTLRAATVQVAVASACPADFNADGFLDFFDFDDFISCFEGFCPPGLSADFNNDGFADFFDFDDFIAAFESGC